MKNINFRGRGDLLCDLFIASLDNQDMDIFVILVDTGQDFVISEYLDGSTEWIQGMYFPKSIPSSASYNDAVIAFARKIGRTVEYYKQFVEADENCGISESRNFRESPCDHLSE